VDTLRECENVRCYFSKKATLCSHKFEPLLTSQGHCEIYALSSFVAALRTKAENVSRVVGRFKQNGLKYKSYLIIAMHLTVFLFLLKTMSIV
jgi:hypothetical protein